MNFMGFPCSTPTGGEVLLGVIAGPLEAFGIVIVVGLTVVLNKGEAVIFLTMCGVSEINSETSGFPAAKTGKGFLLATAAGEGLTSLIIGEIVVIDDDDDDTTGAAVLPLAIENPHCGIGCDVAGRTTDALGTGCAVITIAGDVNSSFEVGDGAISEFC